MEVNTTLTWKSTKKQKAGQLLVANIFRLPYRQFSDIYLARP